MILESLEKNVRFGALADSKRQSLNVVQEEPLETTHRNFDSLIDSNFEIIGKMVREKEARNECNLSLWTIAS